MAWVVVPGTGGIWEYDNAATGADTYSDTPGTISGGVRTYTTSGANPRQTYIKCRKISQPPSTGELDKTYYDAQ